MSVEPANSYRPAGPADDLRAPGRNIGGLIAIAAEFKPATH